MACRRSTVAVARLLQRVRAHGELDEVGVERRVELQAPAIELRRGSIVRQPEIAGDLVLERHRLHALKYALQGFGPRILAGWRLSDLGDLNPGGGFPLGRQRMGEGKRAGQDHHQHGHEPSPFADKDPPHVDQIDFVLFHGSWAR
jgi:hypothetical protein